MSALVASELLKLRGTRALPRLIAATVVVVGVLTVAVVAQGAFGDAAAPSSVEYSVVGTATPVSATATVEEVQRALSAWAIVAYLVAIVGALAIGAERRHGTLATALVRTPRRARYLAAKTAALVAVAAPVALLGYAVNVVVALPLLGHRNATVDLAASTWIGLGVAGVIAAALCAALGVGLGALCADATVAVALVIGVGFVFEPLIAAEVSAAAPYAPGHALAALLGGYPLAGDDDLLGPVAGGLVLAGWAALLWVAGAQALRRRDVG